MLRTGEAELGGTTLVAHKAAGHNSGCTTWTTEVEEDGERYRVVFVCSTSPSPSTTW